MTFIRVLAVTVFLFGVFITLCNGSNGSEVASLSAEQQRFKDRIIFISPSNYDDTEIKELCRDGENYLYIYGYHKIVSIFEEFGNVIHKVKINYELLDEDYEESEEIRHKINENIIKKYSEKWTELYFDGPNFLKFLDEIPHERERIHFPNVTKFEYSGFGCIHGSDFGGSYDLNAIFPKLKSLTLYYTQIFIEYAKMKINPTVFANVTKLTELNLKIASNSLQKKDLDNVLSKNPQITDFSFTITDKIDALHSVVRLLKNLQTLKIRIDGTQFLDHISKKTVFDIKTLKRLSLDGKIDDPRITDLVNCFKQVESVEMLDAADSVTANIGKLMQRHSELKRLKVIRVHGIHSETEFKDKMGRIDEFLNKAKKPIWIPSFEREGNTGSGDLVLTRQFEN